MAVDSQQHLPDPDPAEPVQVAQEAVATPAVVMALGVKIIIVVGFPAMR